MPPKRGPPTPNKPPENPNWTLDEGEEMRMDINDLQNKTVTKDELQEMRDSMEAKLDTKMDSMDTKMDSMKAQLDTKMDSMKAQLDTKMDSMESKMDTKMDSMESKGWIKRGDHGSIEKFRNREDTQK
jgi:hypothetical protein